MERNEEKEHLFVLIRQTEHRKHNYLSSNSALADISTKKIEKCLFTSIKWFFPFHNNYSESSHCNITSKIHYEFMSETAYQVIEITTHARALNAIKHSGLLTILYIKHTNEA